MSWSQRFLSFVGWDGFLPFAVAISPVIVRLLLPKNHIAEIVVAIFVPIAASLVRAMVGGYQIRRICNGVLPILRQAALAVAIVALLLFEMCIAVLTFANNEPLLVWLVPIGAYFTYVGAISIALRSPRTVINS